VEADIVKREGKEDIYPLSIVYSEKEKRKIMLTRFIVLFFLFVILIPKDFLNVSLPYTKFTYIDT
jgi:hypothetical protein